MGRPSNTLFVYDPNAQEIVHRAHLPYGPVLDISLGVGPDGMVYGLGGDALFRVDPNGFGHALVGRYDPGISCGFGLDESGLYFGSGAHLARYVW